MTLKYHSISNTVGISVFLYTENTVSNTPLLTADQKILLQEGNTCTNFIMLFASIYIVRFGLAEIFLDKILYIIL